MTIRVAISPGVFGRIFSGYGYLCALLAAWWVCGCSTTPVQTNVSSPVRKEVVVEQQLRRAAREWDRTPHRMGGLDHNGIDCSGLVKVLYRDLFNVPLPRSSRQQVRQGVAVGQQRLTAGDLVFFKPPHKDNHVGIYLGDGQFLHVSTRRGVMVSHIKEKYWRNSYWTARRILPT